MRAPPVFLGLLAVSLIVGLFFLRPRIAHAAEQARHGPFTTSERLQQYEKVVADRLSPYFQKAGVRYPPEEVTLLILKQEKELQVYAANGKGSLRFFRKYPILAASGQSGPKLREGDGQVPEGLYGVESLNPNSTYHLALRVNYPNKFDRAQALREGRRQLGGDIMIHGSYVSIGCVAMGDPAAEDLFVLVAKAGLSKVRLVFCPFDFRSKPFTLAEDLPPWLPGLYRDLEQTLRQLPLPTNP